jgi:hypothetical protein
MTTQQEDRRPLGGTATQETAGRAAISVTEIERARRHWRVDRMWHRRHVSDALDEHIIGMYGWDAAQQAGIRVGRYGYGREQVGA